MAPVMRTMGLFVVEDMMERGRGVGCDGVDVSFELFWTTGGSMKMVIYISYLRCLAYL